MFIKLWHVGDLKLGEWAGKTCWSLRRALETRPLPLRVWGFFQRRATHCIFYLFILDVTPVAVSRSLVATIPALIVLDLWHKRRVNYSIFQASYNTEPNPCIHQMKNEILFSWFYIMPPLFQVWMSVFSGSLVSDKQGNAPTLESTQALQSFFSNTRGCNHAVRPVSCLRKLLWEMQGLQATLLDNWGRSAVAVMFFDWRFNVTLHPRGGCWLSTIYKDQRTKARIWGYWSVMKAEWQRLGSGGNVG